MTYLFSFVCLILLINQINSQEVTPDKQDSKAKEEEAPKILDQVQIREVHGGSLVNVSDCLFWFSKGGQIVVPKVLASESKSKSDQPELLRFSFEHRPIRASGNCSHSVKVPHSHLQLTFDLNNATQLIRQLHLHLRATYDVRTDRWVVSQFHAIVEPAEELAERNFTLNANDLQAPGDFSYSCSDLHLKSKFKSTKRVEKSERNKKEEEELKEQPFKLQLKRFQLQPFYTEDVFTSSFDCSPLFTIPQFASLFTLILFTLGVVVGISALFRIKPMDRFESAKSKPLIAATE